MDRMQHIFSQWAKAEKKTELASQKVELGLIDDLNKALDQGEDILNGLKEDNKRMSDMQKVVDRETKQREKLFTNREKAADKFFDLEDKFLAAKRQLEEANKSLKSNENQIEGYEAEVAKAEKSKAPKVKKAQNILNVFDKNLQKAEAAAKDLGLKLPIAKYKKMQDNLRKNL